jgi:hypothetical protein
MFQERISRLAAGAAKFNTELNYQHVEIIQSHQPEIIISISPNEFKPARMNLLANSINNEPTEPNQALEPTIILVTDAAAQPPRQV